MDRVDELGSDISIVFCKGEARSDCCKPIAAGGELWVMMRRFKRNARFQQGASEQ